MTSDERLALLLPVLSSLAKNATTALMRQRGLLFQIAAGKVLTAEEIVSVDTALSGVLESLRTLEQSVATLSLKEAPAPPRVM
jgi:hypothetical protein